MSRGTRAKVLCHGDVAYRAFPFFKGGHVAGGVASPLLPRLGPQFPLMHLLDPLFRLRRNGATEMCSRASVTFVCKDNDGLDSCAGV